MVMAAVEAGAAARVKAQAEALQTADLAGAETKAGDRVAKEQAEAEELTETQQQTPAT